MVSVKSEQLSHTRARSQNENQETLLGSDPTKLRTKNYLLNRHVVQCPSEKLREQRQHQQITPGAKIPLLIDRQPRPEQNSSRSPSESSKSTDFVKYYNSKTGGMSDIMGKNPYLLSPQGVKQDTQPSKLQGSRLISHPDSPCETSLRDWLFANQWMLLSIVCLVLN